VPESFHEERKSEIAERRRRRLAVLQSPEDDVQFRMALVLGEYKRDEASPSGRKVWLKHMPDAPLLIDASAWARIERAYGSLFEARDADIKNKLRMVIGAMIYAKREHIYQIDTASFMLITDNWIPIEGVHEADLIDALTEQRRRFVKPLRYDARSVAAFPNVLLLDTGAKPSPLHVLSASMDPRERAAKEKVIKAQGDTPWVWCTDKPIASSGTGGPRTDAVHWATVGGYERAILREAPGVISARTLRNRMTAGGDALSPADRRHRLSQRTG
jgi:hypothetical protein